MPNCSEALSDTVGQIRALLVGATTEAATVYDVFWALESSSQFGVCNLRFLLPSSLFLHLKPFIEDRLVVSAQALGSLRKAARR